MEAFSVEGFWALVEELRTTLLLWRGEALINHVICAGIHVAFTLMKTAANK